MRFTFCGYACGAGKKGDAPRFVNRNLFRSPSTLGSSEQLLLSPAGLGLGFLEIQVRLVVRVRGALGASEQAGDGEELHAGIVLPHHAFVKVRAGRVGGHLGARLVERHEQGDFGVLLRPHDHEGADVVGLELAALHADDDLVRVFLVEVTEELEPIHAAVGPLLFVLRGVGLDERDGPVLELVAPFMLAALGEIARGVEVAGRADEKLWDVTI